MGASLALAGLTACTRQPTEHIMPYVRQPEELIPGRPLFYATATTLNGVANGVLAESHEGRPTKIEGNPEHPAVSGRVRCVHRRLRCLQLYDPDRSQTVSYVGEIRSWGDFFGALREILAAQQDHRRRGHPHSHRDHHFAHHGGARSAAIQKLYPAAKWHQWEPAGPHSARARRGHGVRPAGEHLLRPVESQRGGVARLRIFWLRATAACATRGSFPRAAGCGAARPP